MARITRDIRKRAKNIAQISGTLDELRDVKYESRQTLQDVKSAMQAERALGRRRKFEWAEGGRQAAREARIRKHQAEFPNTEYGAMARVNKDLGAWTLTGNDNDRDLAKGELVMVVSERYQVGGRMKPQLKDWVVDVMVDGYVVRGVPAINLRTIEE
jgi:hypothetical protein